MTENRTELEDSGDGNDEEDEEEIDIRVNLEPYIHQVGGRSCLLLMDENTLCKPVISRELSFYDTMPGILKQFVPKFRGVMEVKLAEDCDGYLRLSAKPPREYLDYLKAEKKQLQHGKLSQRSSAFKHRIRLRKSGSIEIENVTISKDESQDEIKMNRDEMFEEISDDTFSRVYCNISGKKVSHNPWVLRCHQNHFDKFIAAGDKMSRSANPTKIQNFVLLENLTAKYMLPCAIDIKMGIRQHGDDASMEKIKSRQARVASTTSGTLGVRICGMQLYDHAKGRFQCQNKYHGRTLTNEGFKQALHQFLHNGLYFRRELIPLLIEKLDNLRAVIMNLESFRFYTSSLLIIYEGSIEGMCSKSTAINDEPKSIQMETKSSLIDVWMIDFAHSTHSSMPNDQIKHTGYDEGFVFGLDNLINQLKSLENDYRIFPYKSPSN